MIPGAVMRRFRAVARGGITPLEATRREEAVLEARPMASLPPPPPALPAMMPVLALKEGGGAAGAAAAASGGDIVLPFQGGTAPGPRRDRDGPLVTVTIAGVPRSGKRVAAHLVREALARRGVAVDGPAGLRSVPLREAVDGLIGRGWAVRIAFAEDDAEAGDGIG